MAGVADGHMMSTANASRLASYKETHRLIDQLTMAVVAESLWHQISWTGIRGANASA